MICGIRVSACDMLSFACMGIDYHAIGEDDENIITVRNVKTVASHDNAGSSKEPEEHADPNPEPQSGKETGMECWLVQWKSS